ncbi:YqzE family protein [Saliterribacillus persicus]|uniref:YqzE-like protein n=1 Tax=Saliterribacillus persicus TaxID=930114 RepID=A0A368XFX9_9BACI|nr:YqzE family protein [Saliterribacillus persicus]RCW65387.1 YqzE-like protein [Saliterribacillus persicus]
MSGEEYLKYVTQKVVTHLNTPKSKRTRKKNKSNGMSNKWFGILPFAIRIFLSKRKQSSK